MFLNRDQCFHDGMYVFSATDTFFSAVVDRTESAPFINWGTSTVHTQNHKHCCIRGATRRLIRLRTDTRRRPQLVVFWNILAIRNRSLQPFIFVSVVDYGLVSLNRKTYLPMRYQVDDNQISSCDSDYSCYNCCSDCHPLRVSFRICDDSTLNHVINQLYAINCM